MSQLYDDKEKINQIISSLSEDELKELQETLMYFLPIWAGNKVKVDAIDGLPDEDKQFIFQAILLMSFAQTSDSNNAQVASIVESIKNGDDAKVAELISIFNERAEKVRKNYLDQIEKFKYSRLPKSRKQQVDNLRKQSGKEELITKITNEALKGKADVQLLTESIEQYDANVKIIDLSVYSSKALQLNKQHIPALISLVSDPSCLWPQDAINVLNGIKVPNGWYAYGALTVNEYRNFCNNISDSAQWNLIASIIFSKIREKVEVPIVPIKLRHQILTEILDSIVDRRFEVAFFAMYAQIEGLLWDLSIEVDKTDKIFIRENEKELLIDANNEKFESTRIRDVLERTALRSRVDETFLHDFCKEIYEERNSVLHGRQNCFSGCKNNTICFIQKLMVIDYLLELLISEFQANLFKSWDEMPPDVIKRIIDGYKAALK